MKRKIFHSRFMHAVTCALFSVPLLSVAPSAYADIVGKANVISGDVLDIDGRRIRLDGIMAPVEGQSCRINDRVYDCHRIAATALMDLTIAAVVRCTPKREEPDGILIATCSVDGYDLSEGMAYTGWGLAYPRTGNPYLKFEVGARRAKHGLWRGEFVPPWQWKGDSKAN